ncbi:hypothetical protein [Kitasatospora sp. GAS204B]|uniref:hypothetical protein n=1 Tax=unclassified Kitasatospora TaxID=2633591 RepID=UPI0024770CBC|nr:hypothetical protein [Kitasatospora sp. GAS204B]MDH6119064.1 hypothetical protein [Kitasatospora sp. GAS204B]
MNTLRDTGLARSAGWTRRIGAGAVLLCAALGVFFAHAVPGQAAGGSSPAPAGDTPSSTPSTSPLQPPAQPPTSGSGPVHAQTHAS